MADAIIDTEHPVAEIVTSDNRLGDAVQILSRIENGQGSPGDLIRYIELSSDYYNSQLQDPEKAQDPAYQEAARHHQIAREGGPVGLMGFCVA